MKIKKHFAFWALILGTSLAVQAQFGLNVQSRPELAVSQRYNPAFLMDGEFEKVKIGANFGAWFGNSDATIKGVFDEGGTIQPETKDRIISELKGKVSLGGGYNFDLATVNISLNEDTRLGFHLSDQLYVAAGFNEANTVGLLLKGNLPYAGQTISDEKMFSTLYHARSLGVSAGKSLSGGDFKIAGRLNFILGQRMFNAKDVSYSLYTSENGGELDLQADYYLSQSMSLTNLSLLAGQGYGISADLGMSYQINDQMRFDASITQAGMTFWNAKNYENTVDVNFEGISITSLFADSLPEQVQQQADSLRDLILPDSTLITENVPTPFTIRTGITYEVGEKGKITGIIAYCPVKNGPYTQIPVVSVGYTHEVLEGLKVSGNIYGGGFDTFGIGAMANYKINLNDKGIDIIAGGDNLLGLFVGSAGRGMSFFGGIGFTY